MNEQSIVSSNLCVGCGLKQRHKHAKLLVQQWFKELHRR